MKVKKAIIVLALMTLFVTQKAEAMIEQLSTDQKYRIYLKATRYPSGSYMERQALAEIKYKYGLSMEEIKEILRQCLGLK